MKKILFLLVTLSVMSANMLADELTATLQQGDDMQAFYGVDAFKRAYEMASDGAVITLSSGSFNSVDTITKSITINGYNALASYSKSSVDHITILANNVKIEGVYFTTITLGEISNCYLKRCYVNYLRATKQHTNTLVEQSVIYDDYAVREGKNYSIKNSTLCCFRVSNTSSNKVFVTNCVIWYWRWSGGYQPYGVYMNNALGVYDSDKYTCPSSSEFYYNLFFKTYACKGSISFANGCIQEGNEGSDPLIFTKYFSENLTYPSGELIISSMGMDGTTKGIYGGIGFTAMPSIPRITSRTIDSCTDAQGNINVKISATAGPN